MKRRLSFLLSVLLLASTFVAPQQVVRRPIAASLTTSVVEFDALSLLGADASTFASWNDTSGNARNGTTSLTLPTVETNELNGHQISRWNGGMMDWSGNAQSTVWTVIAVLKCTSFASERTVMSANTGGIEGSIPLIWLSTAGKIEIVDTDVAILATSNTALNTSSFYTIAVQYNSTTGAYAFYLNGSADGSGTASAVVFAHFTRIGRRNGNQNLFPGDIAYIALWNSFLSSTELTSRFSTLRIVWAHY